MFHTDPDTYGIKQLHESNLKFYSDIYKNKSQIISSEYDNTRIC